MKSLMGSLLLFLVWVFFYRAESKCSQTCDLALASYYVWPGTNVTFIAEVLNTDANTVVEFNKDRVPSRDYVQSTIRINVPFKCECIRNSFLGHTFQYKVRSGDTYNLISGTYYSNLTTSQMLRDFNSYDPVNIPDNATVNVTVNCFCGNSAVSTDYGLFLTYPLREDDSLEKVSADTNISTTLLQAYNPGVNFSAGSGLLYVPGKDQNGTYQPLKQSTGGLKAGAIAGVSIAAVAGVLFIAGCFYVGFYRRRKIKSEQFLAVSQDLSSQEANNYDANTTLGVPGITVDKSVEFSYEELATATDNFSLANKIGEGGFGAVYFAELRGERAAIKKMDTQATREFHAELKVLTRVHHVNLVRLIGYCVADSLFLVYEYIENGNLSQHLRGSAGMDPLPWTTRVQIALDSARGLEYIHEHTVPVYIHRDIKSANILIDNNFHAKVADFGLTKLTEVGNTSIPTRLVGTFGYMPPEYAQYGDVSPKVDVYAFGVVLYELISAKEAIVKTNRTINIHESKGLVALFENVLKEPDARENLRRVIDPRLGDNYPLDSVLKMAQLAKVCTHENPQLRPSMRSIVVALMTLSSSTEDWDIGSFYDNQTLVNLMSGR